MSLIKLQNEFINIQAQSKTGRLQLIGRLSGSGKAASIDFFDGVVVKVSVGSTHGLAAVKQIASMKLDHARFMKSDNISQNITLGTPETSVIYNLISNQQGSTAADPMVDQVTEILGQLLGKGSGKIVRDIIEKYPPAENRNAFLDKCVDAAANIVGDAQAAKMFKSLRT